MIGLAALARRGMAAKELRDTRALYWFYDEHVRRYSPHTQNHRDFAEARDQVGRRLDRMGMKGKR